MSVSSRVLRKIRGDQDILTKPTDDGSENDDTLFSNAPRTNFNVNRYNLLNDETQSESEVKEDDDKEIDSSHHRDSRVSKRKKKKKKRKSLPTSQKHSSDDIDEVERSVREVNAILGHTTLSQVNDKSGITVVEEKSILSIDKKHLNPNNELKRIFGPEAVQNSETKVRDKNRGLKRNLWLVGYRPQWGSYTRTGPALSMSVLECVNGIQYFKYDHSPSYQAVERQFLACVQSMDSMELMMISNTHPLHINTLIQLSEMCKTSEEYSSAAKLIERALYVLESAFHSTFNIARGNCRLDYRRQENRALFIALFSHLRYVGQRACYRTALEFCKLLLSLSPVDDPMAIVLAMDFYAIRSGEYKWLLQFIEEMEDKRNLSQLPNMALGQAVANFHLHNEEKADEQLQDALIMFPGVLIPLLEKCSISIDSKTQASQFFMDAGQSPALNQLIQLYIGRSYHYWKESRVMHWLEKNTHAVLERISKSDPTIADYAAKRTKRFNCKTPKEVQRHVLLSDIPDVPMTEVYIDTYIFNFDPFPPLDSIDIYKVPERPRRLESNLSAGSLFLRSLMPNFNPEATNAEPEREEGAVGGFQSRLVDMLDSMHELIASLRSQNDDAIYEDDEDASDEGD